MVSELSICSEEYSRAQQSPQLLTAWARVQEAAAILSHISEGRITTGKQRVSDLLLNATQDLAEVGLYKHAEELREFIDDAALKGFSIENFDFARSKEQYRE